MQELTALAGIATALAIGAVSPGPSFVMVARTAASSTRTDGLCAALGMGARPGRRQGAMHRRRFRSQSSAG